MQLNDGVTSAALRIWLAQIVISSATIICYFIGMKFAPVLIISIIFGIISALPMLSGWLRASALTSAFGAMSVFFANQQDNVIWKYTLPCFLALFVLTFLLCVRNQKNPTP